jgi:hypothetical protein
MADPKLLSFCMLLILHPILCFLPGLSCTPDQIIDWVFDVAISVSNVGVIAGKLTFDQFYGLSQIWVSTQIIPKKACIALVGVSFGPNMDVGFVFSWSCDKVDFSP